MSRTDKSEENGIGTRDERIDAAEINECHGDRKK
jgi:hypothetical protein